MAKKLTILIDDAVCAGLHRVVGRGGIGKFIENLARPHVAQNDLAREYRDAARDAKREKEARQWTEGLAEDADEARRIGRLSADEMLGVERALRIQLGLR